jgi:hypothetical protein
MIAGFATANIPCYELDLPFINIFQTALKTPERPQNGLRGKQKLRGKNRDGG